MKGIILAGGHGTRLYPLTGVTSKQLQPVFDKPMIYYPLSTLMLGGVKDIAIISTPEDLPKFKSLLGKGSDLGIKLSYFEQSQPRGIAEAFIICEKFIGKNRVSLILGDNIFYGNLRLRENFETFTKGALIYGYAVRDPEKYGIIEFDSKGNVVDIVEKPKLPKSRYAVPGLYIYDNKVVEISKKLEPSKRGELEITAVNNEYLKMGNLEVRILGRGIAWLDTGSPSNLHEASSFISSVEKRQSHKIGCIEEVAFRENYIDLNKFSSITNKMPDCDYRDYLKSIIDEYGHNSRQQHVIKKLQS